MRLKTTPLKNIISIAILLLTITTNAQEKIDGVAVVVGKNIVLDSDISKFKKEIELKTEGKTKISDCEMLEELMKQKLLAHHAVVDSVVVTQKEIDSRVDRSIQYFTQQYGSAEKVIKAYGFNDLFDLKKELARVQKENALIEKEQAKINKNTDVTPEEVRLYFKGLKDKKALPEFPAEVEIAQITLYAEPTKEEKKRVINKLKEIKREVEDGASFKMKAIINSDDPSVTQNSGNMGLLKKDSPFIKEFKEVAFSLDEGEISEPFKTIFGYHIIKLHKIRGEGREVSHILLQPKISDEKLKKTQEQLENIKLELQNGILTFEEAVKKYSEDKETKNNGGLIINPYTGESNFDLTGMPPALYARVYELKKGEYSDIFYDETRGGEKMYKILYMKDRKETHTADLVNDYVKIQRLALAKKKQETIQKWVKQKIKDTYIKLGKDYKNCTFKNDWKKEGK